MKSSTKLMAGIIGILLILIFSLQAFATPIIESDTATINEIKDNYWMTVCSDSQTIEFNQNMAEDYCLADQNGSAINCTDIQGLYTESIHTNQTHPQCINQITEPDGDTFPEYNITCILDTCATLIEFNQLTGEQRTLWTKEGGWL